MAERKPRVNENTQSLAALLAANSSTESVLTTVKTNLGKLGFTTEDAAPFAAFLTKGATDPAQVAANVVAGLTARGLDAKLVALWAPKVLDGIVVKPVKSYPIRIRDNMSFHVAHWFPIKGGEMPKEATKATDNLAYTVVIIDNEPHMVTISNMVMDFGKKDDDKVNNQIAHSGGHNKLKMPEGVSNKIHDLNMFFGYEA